MFGIVARDINILILIYHPVLERLVDMPCVLARRAYITNSNRQSTFWLALSPFSFSRRCALKPCPRKRWQALNKLVVYTHQIQYRLSVLLSINIIYLILNIYIYTYMCTRFQEVKRGGVTE